MQISEVGSAATDYHPPLTSSEILMNVSFEAFAALPWITIFPWLGASAGFMWGIISYLLSRQRALALERTKLIFKEWSRFEKDPDIQEAVQLLVLEPQRICEAYLTVMTAEEPTKAAPTDRELALKLEKCLMFLWRIAYAHRELGTLKLKDVDAFGWYIWAIYNHRAMQKYLNTPDGDYKLLMEVAKTLNKKIWRAKRV